MKGFYIYGRGGHLGHVTWTIYINTFVPPSIGGSTKNLALIGQAVSEKMFEKCGRTTEDEGRQRTTDHGYTISSPCEPEGSGELKSRKQYAFSKHRFFVLQTPNGHTFSLSDLSSLSLCSSEIRMQV